MRVRTVRPPRNPDHESLTKKPQIFCKSVNHDTGSGVTSPSQRFSAPARANAIARTYLKTEPRKLKTESRELQTENRKPKTEN